MNVIKRVAAIALLLFVGATVGVLIAQEVGREKPSAETEIASTPSPDDVEAADEEISAHVASGSDSDANPQAGDPDTQTPDETTTACVVEAIYFHNTLRCRTCRNIEQSALAAMEEAFADAFDSGQLRWMAVNMEEEPQVVEQFDLVKPSLVLMRKVDGELSDWITLEDTWVFIGREARFSLYIEESTQAFLEGCP